MADSDKDRNTKVAGDSGSSGEELAPVENPDICENINVYCRVRPFLASEQGVTASSSSSSCLELLANGQCNYRNGDSKRDSAFQFTKCFSVESTQSDLFEVSARPIVDSVLRGYNGTLLAYGPTNSGKTFTMRGVGTDPGSPLIGIIPRCVDYMLNNSIPGTELWVSYLQIYCESISDLLLMGENNGTSNNLLIRERSYGQVYVEGLSSYNIKSLIDLRAVLDRGDANRYTASTNINETSSRSHAALIIKVVSPADSEKQRQESSLTLVDLAGSER
jgi:hypothetical protein